MPEKDVPNQDEGQHEDTARCQMEERGSLDSLPGGQLIKCDRTVFIKACTHNHLALNYIGLGDTRILCTQLTAASLHPVGIRFAVSAAM